MKKIIAAAFVVILTLICPKASASYRVPSYVKVGLKFSDTKVDIAEFSVSGGCVAGYEYGYGFYRLIDLPEAESVSVRKADGAYLVSAQTFATLKEAADRANELRGMGVPAFGAYYNSQNRIMIGKYLTLDEAAGSMGDVIGAVGAELEPVLAGEKMVIVEAGGYYLAFDCGETNFGIVPQDQSAGFIGFGGRRYRGYMLVSRRAGSDMSVINLVGMDDYIASVVGSEMYPTWPIEALKAQAVVARTYVCQITGYQKYGIDVTDDTRTQAYGGIEKETDSTRRAAYETSGVVVLYGGKPAQTYYSACSGGKTADVYSAWGGGAGLDYLKSVDDPYEDTEKIPGAVWTVTYTADELSHRLESKNIHIGRVTDVVVLERGEQDERVRHLRLVGTEGTADLSFERIKTVLGLKSTWFYIDTASNGQSANVLSDGGVSQIPLSGRTVLGKDGTAVLSGPVFTIGKDGTAAIESQGGAPESFVFRGRGYTHGVGMSQYGAKGMAEHGFDWRAIISHYYPGTELSVPPA